MCERVEKWACPPYFRVRCFCFLCFTFACFLPAANVLVALPSRSVKPSITLISFRTEVLLIRAISHGEMRS